jgi:hypothetical protein
LSPVDECSGSGELQESGWEMVVIAVCPTAAARNRLASHEYIVDEAVAPARKSALKAGVSNAGLGRVREGAQRRRCGDVRLICSCSGSVDGRWRDV